MPTLAERLETATTTLEGLVANTTGTGDMVLKTGAVIAPASVNGNTFTTGTGTLTLGSYTLTVAATASVSGTNTGDQTAASLGLGTTDTVTHGTIIATTAMFTYGSATDSSVTVHNGTITNANADCFVVVQGTGKLKSTGSVITAAQGGTGVSNGSSTITLGGSVTTGGLFATVGTFSSGGNFATGGTFSTGGTFTTIGDFVAGGAFATSHAFTTSGGALTLTLTGTTNVTLPTSGTLATTSQLLSLATAAEALAGVNATAAMTPALAALQDAAPIVKDGFSGAGWTLYTSPTGGFSTGNTDFGVDISFGTATGGTGRYTGPGNTAALYVGKGRGVINWSKPGALSFLLLFYSVELDAVSTFRFGWGKSSSGLTWGDPAVKYIGIARTGTGVLRIQTHNGTTLTNTNTTFTPTLNQAAFVHLSWDGAGNVAITVNGTSYGTATGAPTGDSSSSENRLTAEGQNASTATLQGNVQVSDLALSRFMF